MVGPEVVVANFDSEALNCLHDLLAFYPDLKVVLSSNWRLLGDIDYLKELFSCYYFSSKLIDKTGEGMISRGKEIEKWLLLNSNSTCNYNYNLNVNTYYVIFDDYDDQLTEYHANRFIKVDMLKQHHVEQAKSVLGQR
jgi:hypothetical protein